MFRVPPSCPASFRRRVERCSAVLAGTALCCLLFAAPAWAQVTLLVPGQPSIEAPAKTEKSEAQAKGREEGKRPAPRNEQKRDQKTDRPATEKPAAAPAQEKQKNPAAPQPAVSQPASPQPANGQPSQPTPTAEADREKDKDAAAQAPAPQAARPPVPEIPAINEEIDFLVSLMRPFKREGLSMDMPQMFAVWRYGNDTPQKDGVPQPERRDLLGDMEEILYLDQKAWGANVALTQPGLYQFAVETRPWWDAARNRFVQHYVKTVLPVYGVERGWERPVGQRFEILPLTRPFGLTAPALFSGVAVLDGKALTDAPVRMARINVENRQAPTPWHEELAARTDKAGQFAFILNQPGWWCCTAFAPGDPLKGPDGQPKPLKLGALFWLYVDGPTGDSRKR